MGISIAEPSGSAAYLATLLIAVSNGDDAAFRRFRDATDRKVMKVAMAILRDHHAAEDVAQDVYLSVWNRASSFDGRRGGAIAWLSAMTRNRSLDYLRRPSARRLHDSWTSLGIFRIPARHPTKRPSSRTACLSPDFVLKSSTPSIGRC